MSKITLYLVSANKEEIYKVYSFCKENDFELECHSQESWDKLISHKEGGKTPHLISGSVNRIPNVTSSLPSSNEKTIENPNPSNYSDNILSFNPNSLQEAKSMSIQPLEEIEKDAIHQAIAKLKGNLTEVAKALGLGRATLYRKIKIYKIDVRSIRQKKVA